MEIAFLVHSELPSAGLDMRFRHRQRLCAAWILSPAAADLEGSLGFSHLSFIPVLSLGSSLRMDYLTSWLLVSWLAMLCSQAEGACVHQGSLFANNTVWKPDSCQQCSCHSDIVVCDTTSCRDPQCDFQKGEVLQVPVNKCCPECVARLQGFCQHEGKLHGHNTEWIRSDCTMCFCMNGKVSCVPKHCPVTSCRRGEMKFVAEGDCCPKCIGTAESCRLDGRLVNDGDEWQPSQCSKCVCKNSVIQCYTTECLPVLCKKDENLSLAPGKCCPRCLPNSCSVSGKLYEHGEQWKKNACTTCMCSNGQVRCHVQPCTQPTCEKGQNKMKRLGQCCEECLSSKGSCLYDGSIRYHGELWNGSRCEFCMCHRGQVLCQAGECARVECAWGEELVHLEGKCCPECISSGSYCVYKESAEEMPRSDLTGIKHLTNGERWSEGLCKECECRDSLVTCYTRSCPPCPVGMLALNVDGECCPECKQVRCHLDCLTCSQTFDHCDICRDGGKLLQLGSCVHSCDPGFYQDGSSCLACKKICSTCEDGFECTTCHGSLLMKSGHCVATCGDGYLPDHGNCAACHDSCSTCRGPSERDCLTCKDQSYMMKDGACMAACDQGFFMQNGICSACDQSCATCHSNNPACLTCYNGSVLLEGKCIPKCTKGFYAHVTGRCRACHDTCAGCLGHLATQCTSCSPTLVLHQGQCLSTCMEGLYDDLGICKACHPSCRACVGPGNSHCTMCAEPRQVLQVEQDYYGKQYGICQFQCKTHFFIENTNVCRECHASCYSCAGMKEANCIDCLSPRVLHDGRCLLQCLDGFFSKNATCSYCHPSCKECSGYSEAHCISCHPHATLIDGHCKTACKEGQYLNLVGYCVDCRPNCQKCVADLRDTGSVCLTCDNSHHFIFGDQCLPDCGVGYYTEGRACKKCHPSCKSCKSHGPLSCTSCEPGKVLSHNGMCSLSCFPGFYSDIIQGLCKACNSQCFTCDSSGACISCKDPTKVLLFGDCQYESCTQQYYLDNFTRTCKECDWSCNACNGPLKTDCLQCMEGYVLHDGACLEHCPPSFHKKADMCQRCEDNHCTRCSGPNICLQCEAPFYLMGTQCVRACSSRYYLNQAKQTCTACPAGCLECSGTQHCHLCDNITFLKNNQCVFECGPGFAGNTENRVCQVNVNPPVLHVNDSLSVGIGGTEPLDFSIMNAQDKDSGVESLLYYVVSPPTSGKLVKVLNGKEETLDTDAYFTWRDLREQRVRFKHNKEKSRNGNFSVKVTDGQFFSEAETIHIQAFSRKATLVLRNEALLIGRGEIGVITSSVLDFRDEDNPQDVVVVVVDSPQHGKLINALRDAPVHHFRPGDIANGTLHYVHDDSNSQSDSAVLQVNDEHHFQNIIFQIKISQKVCSTSQQHC